jgi:phosphatidylinositol-3-phosphatase
MRPALTVGYALRFALVCLVVVSQLTLAEEVARRGGSSVEQIPRPDHVVIVIEENKSYTQIIGNMAAPYINTLANSGALFSQSFAITHPSQPNYLALFSGRTQGIVDDRCPLSLSGDNLATELRKKGFSFATYSESMPSIGYTGCSYGPYFRKHNPAANWQGINVSPEMNKPFTMFPSDFSKLPTVSIVVPNQLNDMHDDKPPESIIKGDRWLKERLDPYLKWAATHNSLLILTWDEDDDSSNNHIATIFFGPMVKRGVYKFKINHYNLLRTIIDMYELTPIVETNRVSPIIGAWIQVK